MSIIARGGIRIAMHPGTISFRKHCERILPQRGGEAKSHYIERLARHFGLTTPRMNVLYYDQRKDNARFTPSEYQTIFGSTPIHDPRLEENQELREELKEIKQLIRAQEANRNAKLKLLLEAFAG